MTEQRKPKQLDTFWPTLEQSQLPFSPHRDPNIAVSWATPNEATTYQRHCKEGRPNRYSMYDIIYSYNSRGFRCMNFDEVPKDAPVFVSVGCSNTEGIGLPEHHTWPHLLCARATLETGVSHINLNLGLGGSSNRHIALRAVRAMRTLRPITGVFIAWTYPHRLHYVYEDGELHDWWAPNAEEIASEDEKMKRKRLYFEKIHTDEFDLHNLMTDITMVNLAAEAFDIPVCNSFLYLNHDVQAWVNKRVAKALVGWRMFEATARDLVHPGHEHNEWVSGQMFDWWKANR
jgi:hypothetical protein